MPRKRKVKRWIQKIPIKKGALHRQLGIPIDKIIPLAVLKKASKEPGKLGRRARLALRFRQFKRSIPRNKRS
jgi:hypothetical protein